MSTNEVECILFIAFLTVSLIPPVAKKKHKSLRPGPMPSQCQVSGPHHHGRK